MTTQELKAVQAPIKDLYRNEPQKAVVTLRSHAEVGAHQSCSVQTGRALVEAGLHPATGGTGMLACSGDMLLDALVACAGVTLSTVATSLEISLRSARVEAEGDLDFRGTLGVDKTVPVGFTAIRVTFIIDTDVSDELIATLLKLTERYCVVYQTLKGGVEMSSAVALQQ